MTKNGQFLHIFLFFTYFPWKMSYFFLFLEENVLFFKSRYGNTAYICVFMKIFEKNLSLQKNLSFLLKAKKYRRRAESNLRLMDWQRISYQLGHPCATFLNRSLKRTIHSHLNEEDKIDLLCGLISKTLERAIFCMAKFFVINFY